MSWYRLPSGMPCYTVDGGQLALRYLAEGATILAADDVPAAIAAWAAGTAVPPGSRPDLANVLSQINTFLAAAQASATSAGGDAHQTGLDRTAAAAALTQATDAATAAGGSASQAGQSAQAANTSRQGAQTAQASAETARDRAEAVGSTNDGIIAGQLKTSGSLSEKAMATRYGRGISPFNFGAVGDGVTDDGAALEQFLAYITANDVGVAHAGGTFACGRHLALGNAATKNLAGRCVITFTGPGGWSGTAGVGITVAGWTGGRWEALVLNAPSSGVSNYASKTWHTGLHLTSGTNRSQFGQIEGTNWAFELVACSGGNTSALDLGKIKATDCGSGHYNGTTHYGRTTTWSNPVNNGAAGSLAQTTTLTVATLPPAFITEGFHGAVGQAPYLIRLTNSNGVKRLHWITAVDTNASTVTVFPWVDTNNVPTSGDNAIADYVWGGALYVIGGDSNIHNVGRVDAIRCGVRQTLAGLYAPTIAQGTGQFCGVHILMGARPDASSLGGALLNEYFEGPGEHIALLTRPTSATVAGFLASSVGLDLARCSVVGNPRLADFSESTTYQTFGNFRFAYANRIHSAIKRPFGASNASNQSITLNRSDQLETFAGNTFTFTVDPLDLALHRLTGYDTFQVLIVGTGSNGAPSGTITFNVPTGWTLNGGSTAVQFTGATAAARFVFRFDPVALNAIVTKIA